MISAKPNNPIATVAKPRPSASSGMLKAIRDAPVSMSDRTIESSSPNTIIAIAFSTDPLASTTAKIRPSTISEKYSAGPNASASLFRHLEAVERGDHRPGLTGNVDQDRCGRTTILGAIIDAGQHDQRAHRRQAKG